MINATPGAIADAFIQPEPLVKFWLSASDHPLEIGRAAQWSFLVPGTKVQTTATRLDRQTGLA